MNPLVDEYIKREVPDWDDEVAATARFKAFSGQRSDWEPKFFFWRDLILKVARHLGVCIIQASEVRNSWFIQGGLTPLCIEHVLLEMYNRGDILRTRDLVDPSSGRLPQLLKRVVHLMGVSRSLTPEEIFEDRIILRTLLEERAAEVLKLLSESHWTPFCVITMEKLQSICNGSDEASAILSYLSGIGKARLLSCKTDYIKGVKVSLVPAAVPTVSGLDSNILHLIWTAEKLQQQLDVIDQRCETSRKLALAFKKSGNKQVALNHLRQLKLTSESREKCNSLLNRVEEVLRVIADAESMKKVSEAIQIGARAIKEIGISVEEVQLCMQELDESVTSQKEVEEVLESIPLQHMGIEDESVMEELKALELELDDEFPQIRISETPVGTLARAGKSKESTGVVSNTLSKLKKAEGAAEKVDGEESAKSLSNSFSNLKLEAA